jgi:hypothetical protein
MRRGRKMMAVSPFGAYCSMHKITMQQFIKAVKLSEGQVYKINRNPDSPRVLLDSLVKIYKGTRDEFGDGLTPDRYLSKGISSIVSGVDFLNDLSSSSGETNEEPQVATREASVSAEEGLDDPYIEHINNEVNSLKN